jgi:hypothetical protein
VVAAGIASELNPLDARKQCGEDGLGLKAGGRGGALKSSWYGDCLPDDTPSHAQPTTGPDGRGVL